MNVRSLPLRRLSLLCGLMLSILPVRAGAAAGAADTGAAPAVEESESNDAARVLEFRIAPRRAGSDRRPSPLAEQQIARCVEDLAENGPSASAERDDEFVWLKMASRVKLSGDLITEEYRGTKYLLVHNWPPLAIWPGDSWRLRYVVQAPARGRGKPHVGFWFDASGPDHFYYLTSTNMGEALAAVVEGKVVSVPTISTAVGSQALASGNFARGRDEEMLKVLREEVLPAALAVHTARAASAAKAGTPRLRRPVRTYLIPVLIIALVVSIAGILIYR